MSYDPSIGRWMEEDPAGDVDGSNLYQLEESNPVNRVDPTGSLAQVTVNGNDVTIEVPVEFAIDGDIHASVPDQQKLIDLAQKAWTGKFGKYNVKTKLILVDCSNADKYPHVNIITLKKRDPHAQATNVNPLNGRSHISGAQNEVCELMVADPTNVDDGARITFNHEVGHLLGLPDRYRDKPTTKPASQPGELLIESVPNSGDENDIMGDSWMGKPTENDIGQIVNGNLPGITVNGK